MTPEREIAQLKANLAECRRGRLRAEEDLDTMARELLTLQESFSKLARSAGKTPGEIAGVGRGDPDIKRRRKPRMNPAAWWRRWPGPNLGDAGGAPPGVVYPAGSSGIALTGRHAHRVPGDSARRGQK